MWEQHATATQNHTSPPPEHNTDRCWVHPWKIPTRDPTARPVTPGSARLLTSEMSSGQTDPGTARLPNGARQLQRHESAAGEHLGSSGGAQAHLWHRRSRQMELLCTAGTPNLARQRAHSAPSQNGCENHPATLSIDILCRTGSQPARADTDHLPTDGKGAQVWPQHHSPAPRQPLSPR